MDTALRALPRVIDVMAEELGWGEARAAQEWTATVRFLRSMGLDDERLAVTRDEVLRGDVKALRPRRDGTAPHGGAKVGRGREIEAAALAASEA